VSITSQGPPDEPRYHDLLMRIGHHTLKLRHANFAAIIIALFLPPQSWQTTLLIWLGFALMILGVGGGFYHDRRLCLRCGDDFPLDVAAKAEKRRWMFWLAHHPILSLSATFVPNSIGLLFSFTGQTGLIKYCLTITFLWMGVFVHAAVTHQRYQLWCPWCRRRDDGDDGVFVPDPDPAPAIQPEPEDLRV
jgi:hypothetical protein